MAPHSSTLAWKIPWIEEAVVYGVAKSQTQLSDFTFTFHFYALEKEMATHSNVLAWRIPGTGEPGRLQSMWSLEVGHNFTLTFTFHFYALEKEMATHSSVLAWRIARDRGAWWAAVYRVVQSWTQLK